MTISGLLRAHGHRFRTVSDHRQAECTWCRQAKDTAVQHMKDATLLTTKSTKYETMTGKPHTVRLERLGKDAGKPGYEEYPYYSGLSGHSLLGEMPLSFNIGGHIPVPEMSGQYLRLDPKRPVVLELNEAEAATVVKLLDREEAVQSEEADAHYQNGDGFEERCADARTLAVEAEKIADRLRKALGTHLDKAYAGEL
jgi:hypothetical protein